jgi:DNA-binding IclR family transcriptional regulator
MVKKLLNNKYLILKYFTEGVGDDRALKTSQVEISGCTGMSRPTVSKLVLELIQEGMLIKSRKKGVYQMTRKARDIMLDLKILMNKYDKTGE